MLLSSRGVFLCLFALSGFSGLIYESIWTHYLKLFLGHAAYAQTLVLAIFMGGMAVGSWVSGQYSSRWRNLLLGYAVAEGLIGLFALFFHPVFVATLAAAYGSIIPQLGTPGSILAFKWVLSILLILPQSILLGMTFPLMSAGILRVFAARPGSSIAMLYFSNSIGAFAGVLTSGFVLIRLTGLPGTIRIAGLINIALALTVWALSRNLPASTVIDDERRGSSSPTNGTGWFLLFLVASLVTGTASFIYEIGWIRMLSLVLGSSTHSFELMLSAFILGIAIGGVLVQRRIDRIAFPVRFLALVQVVMGVLALTTLLLYGHTFEVMQWIVRTLDKTSAGYDLFNLSSSAIAISIMLPTTICAGMTLPLITLILLKRGHGERSIGLVYASNTVGAILGVLFAVHLGMPLLGLKGLIESGASLDIALGLFLLWSALAGYRRRVLPAAITAVGVCAIAAVVLFAKLDPYKMGSGVYRLGELTNPRMSRLVYHKDGKTATITCFLDVLGNMQLRTNGKVDAGLMMGEGPDTIDTSTMSLLAVIPMALHPDARTAAVIGLGSGFSTQTLLLNPSLEEVETVEIEQRVVEGAKYFGKYVELVYGDPRSKIYIDDAKTFFSTRQKKYDIIISEPSNPWVSGVAGLFSKEFYSLIGNYMQDNAVFAQWVQLYEIDVDLVISVLKAISSSFSDWALFYPNDTELVIVARKDGVIPPLDSAVLKIPAIREVLKRIDVTGVQDLTLRKIGSKRVLRGFLESFEIPANSDYYPVLDQNAARARFLRSSAKELLDFTRVPLPILSILGDEISPSSPTSVNPYTYSFLSQAAFAAMGLRDYLIQGDFDSRYRDVPSDRKEMGVLFRRQFLECVTASDRSARLGILFQTANSLIPYLNRHELESIWASVETGACATQLSPAERDWLSLFVAVSRRDVAGMVDTSKRLLEGPGDWPLGAVRYLVASEMLGLIAQGKSTESSLIWSQYKDVLFPDKEPNLVFRLLTAAGTAGLP